MARCASAAAGAMLPTRKRPRPPQEPPSNQHMLAGFAKRLEVLNGARRRIGWPEEGVEGLAADAQHAAEEMALLDAVDAAEVAEDAAYEVAEG